MPLQTKSLSHAFKRGFTLIELLVVIAIIAILASILFPVFGRARENARRSSCQSNLKQLGIGLMQYTQDYDERMPGCTYNYSFPGNVAASWDLTIQPYIKSTQVLVCPSDTTSPTMNLPGFGPSKRSYSISRYMWDAAYNVYTGPGISLAAIPSPSLTVSLGERSACPASTTAYDTWGYCGETQSTDNWATESGKPFYDGSVPAGAGGRHLGTTNVLYADGHVKSLVMTKGQLTQLPGHPNGNSNTPFNVGTWIFTGVDLPR